MRNIKHWFCNLISVGWVNTIVVFPVRICNRRRAIVYRIRVTEGVACHQVETPCKVLFKCSACTVAVTLIGISQIDDSIIVSGISLKVRSCRRRYCWINGIGCSIRLQCKVIKPYIVQRFWVKTFKSHLDIAGKHSLHSQVCTEHLRILEALADGVDSWFGCTSGCRHCCSVCICAIMLQRRNASCSLNGCSLHLYTGVVPCVRQPNKRHTACKQTYTSTEQYAVTVVGIPTETYTWRPHDLGRWHIAHGYIIVGSVSTAVEVGVTCRMVHTHWNVQTQTIGKVQVVVDVPFVLNIECPLCSFYDSRPLCGARQRYIRIVIGEFPCFIV